MTSEVKNEKAPNKFWLLSPIFTLFLAIIVLAINSAPGLDGAARSTAVVFWYIPTIAWTGYKSICELHLTQFKALGKFLFICLWVVPSLPIGLMSLFGLLLISDTGFGILF